MLNPSTDAQVYACAGIFVSTARGFAGAVVFFISTAAIFSDTSGFFADTAGVFAILLGFWPILLRFFGGIFFCRHCWGF